MKKIFTLIAATLFTAALFAADRKPVVTVKASRNYEVIIDGQSYFSNSNTMNLSGIRSGQHSIKVYEVNKSFFRKFRKLVSAASFEVRRNDIDIFVDFRGQISISESRFGQDKWNERGNDDRNGHDKNDGYGNDHHNDKNDRDNKRF
jgi:hypothetical protein